MGNFMKIKAAILATTVAIGLASAAKADTIDFSSFPLYTPITAVDGVTISLYGGAGTGTAETGSFGTASLGNSPTGDYPTSDGIAFSFSGPVSNVSFTFDNFGDNSDFNGGSFEQAFSGATLVDTQYISAANANSFGTVNVGGSNITLLNVDNGTDGAFNWEFGVGELTFTPSSGAVPEPSTWALMLIGFGMVGFAMRKRSNVTTKITYA